MGDSEKLLSLFSCVIYKKKKLCKNRKLALVGIIPNQILFPFSDKDRRNEVPPLPVGDKLITCPQEKAEVFNAPFCQQCSTSSPAAFPSCPLLLKSSSVTKPSFQFSPVSSLDVASLLRSLPSGKSVGPNNISNELPKISAPAISESLAALINNSLSSGVYPQSWKESVVAPVLKAGNDATKPVSYRPISLLSNVSKVAEKVVHSQLVRFCLGIKIIPDKQLGLLKGRSLELQLLATLETWHESLDSRNHVHSRYSARCRQGI